MWPILKATELCKHCNRCWFTRTKDMKSMHQVWPLNGAVFQLFKSLVRNFGNRTLKSEDRPRKKGRLVDWKNLYFPMGCGMIKGGVPADVPLVQQADGSFSPVNIQFYGQFLFEVNCIFFTDLKSGSASTAYGNYRPSTDAVRNPADANGFNDGNFNQEQEIISGWFSFIVRCDSIN